MKNIYGQDVESVYEKNETMRLLGYQNSIEQFWQNDEVREQVRQISEARPYSFTIDVASDLFMLGCIHGKREERARRKKVVSTM